MYESTSCHIASFSGRENFFNFRTCPLLVTRGCPLIRVINHYTIVLGDRGPPILEPLVYCNIRTKGVALDVLLQFRK